MSGYLTPAERVEWATLATADFEGLPREALIASIHYLARSLLTYDRVVQAARAYLDSDPPRPEWKELTAALDALPREEP